MQIRDNRLYRIEYGTFEEYCKGKWDISRPRAYQLIKSAEAKDNLSTVVDIPERQLRPLTRIKDPDEQREVYQKAPWETGGLLFCVHSAYMKNQEKTETWEGGL